MTNTTDKIASKFLGKKVSGSETYDPNLLVAVPREYNRTQYDISSSKLPFDGFDIWHAYEFSCLTNNGLPVTRVIKLKYSCNSDCIVESKSLKLYLNSYNMSNFGVDINDCLEICKSKIEYDLSNLLATNVTVSFLDESVEKSFLFDNYENIYNLIDVSSVNISKFKEAPELLKIASLNESQKFFLTFDSLRSNCRVTHQPDFGDVFIYYRADKQIIEDSLVKYLCSFRSEYHFHEECCEMIFKRLLDLLGTDAELLVTILYTRRGGIDICPVRWSKNIQPLGVETLLNTNIFARKSVKQ